MAEATYHFELGNFRCITFNEQTRQSPVESRFGNVPAGEREPVLAEFGLGATIPSAINVLYIDADEHKILVDTGLGQGALFAGLEAEGISFDEIDRIIITHGHGDHLGGVLNAENQRVFPNAHYFIGRREWQHWQEDPHNRNAQLWQRIREHLPVERITFIDTETEFMPGICPVFIPGHTPGQMGLLVESAGEKMLHIADAAHHALQCAYPDWSFDLDEDRAVSRVTRRQIWQRAARENLRVMGYHLLNSGRGHVVAEGDRWRWQPEIA